MCVLNYWSENVQSENIQNIKSMFMIISRRRRHGAPEEQWHNELEFQSGPRYAILPSSSTLGLCSQVRQRGERVGFRSGVIVDKALCWMFLNDRVRGIVITVWYDAMRTALFPRVVYIFSSAHALFSFYVVSLLSARKIVWPRPTSNTFDLKRNFH